jgi:metabolite-proton symporter
MSQPAIITVAITGAIPRKADTPAVPVTPSEQIESTHEAFEAGASVVHIHVRNPDESPSSDPALFGRVQEGVSHHCPGMIIQFSTGGRGREQSERGKMLYLKPDMASLATGSVNFPKQIYENPPQLVEDLASTMLACDVKPEIEGGARCRPVRGQGTAPGGCGGSSTDLATAAGTQADGEIKGEGPMQATSQGSAGMSISKVALASAIGTTIEWYDFFLYGVVTPIVLNKLFFPNYDPIAGTLLAYTTFFVGFLSRPIGGIIFGHYGDRIGRKTVLVLTLLIMGIATFLIGLLPTYASIGIWAPAMLLVLRIFQGIGIGGEWGGAVLMAVEHSPPGKRGFYGSWPQVGVPAGLLLASGMVYLLSFLPEDDFFSWGWRISFLISAVLVAIGLYIRLKIMETPAFMGLQQAQKIVHTPFLELIRTHGWNTLLGLGARYIEGVTFNIFGVFIIAYVTGALQLPRQTALAGVMISSALMIIMLPIYGNLSDRVGRRRMFAVAGLLIGILSFPAFWLMDTKSPILIWLAITVPFAIVYPAVYGPQAALFSELFDTRVRYTGISFVYQFSGIFASGLTPIIATALLPAAGNRPWLICGYILIVSIISAASVFAMRDMHKRDMTEDNIVPGLKPAK